MQQSPLFGGTRRGALAKMPRGARGPPSECRSAWLRTAFGELPALIRVAPTPSGPRLRDLVGRLRFAAFTPSVGQRSLAGNEAAVRTSQGWARFAQYSVIV